MVIQQDSEKDNICCPELIVLACDDTTEHCHLACGFSRTLLQNKTVKELCIGNNFKTCVNLQKE